METDTHVAAEPEFNWRPPDGVLADYRDFWEPTTDAPGVYHVACGLVVLASIVENRVYLPFGGERIYPNLWHLILGPSSFYRKSTTVSKAKRTISRMHSRDGAGDEGDGQPRSPILANEWSREAMLRALGDRGQRVMCFSEFSGFLAVAGRDYMSGSKETLADLYDCPATYTRMVGQNTFTIRNACLSILAASQTGWFLEKLKAGDVRGGFLARFAYWPAFSKPRFIAIPPEPDMAIGNRLARGLQAMRKVEGAAVFAPGVVDFYSDWLEQHERQLGEGDQAADLSAFWSRLSMMTLKYALLLQVSRDQSLTITSDTMGKAISLTEHLKRSLRRLFAHLPGSFCT